MAPPQLHEKYKVAKLLGSGMFGEVFSATNKTTGEAVAMKFVRTTTDITKGCLEIPFMQVLHGSDAFPKLIDYEYQPVPGRVVIIMEKLDFDMAHAMGLSWLKSSHKVQMISSIVDALRYMHDRGLAHLDIKPENVLVKIARNSEGKLVKRFERICLCDFTCSQFFHGLWKGRVPTPESTYATPLYRPPEVALRSEYKHVAKADIWGVGIILFCLVFGEHEFEQVNDDADLTTTQVRRRMHEEGEDKADPTMWKIFVQEYEEGIAQQPGDEEEEIPTNGWVVVFANEIVEYVKQNLDRRIECLKQAGESDLAQLAEMLPRMLVIEPSRRISSEELSERIHLIQNTKYSAGQQTQQQQQQNPLTLPMVAKATEAFLDTLDALSHMALNHEFRMYDASRDTPLPLGCIIMVLYHVRPYVNDDNFSGILAAALHICCRFFEIGSNIENFRAIAHRRDAIQGAKRLFQDRIVWFPSDLDDFCKQWTVQNIQHFLIEHPQDLFSKPLFPTTANNNNAEMIDFSLPLSSFRRC